MNIVNSKKIVTKNTISNRSGILEYYFNKTIPEHKTKLDDVKVGAFNIPQIKDFNKLLTTNHKVSELKIIQKHYSIKCNGNKEYLKQYLYNYLFYSHKTNIIQKNARAFFIKRYIMFHGPAFYKRNMCSNDVDFCTLDDLASIPYNQFISFKDENNHIYGFDIISLYTLFKNRFSTIKKNNNITNEGFIDIENPFTKQKFNTNILEQLINYINISKILKIAINLEYDELIAVSYSKQAEMKILTLFQKIDSLGNYTNIKWFLNLEKKQLIRFARELKDIWDYRANLLYEIKREIVPQQSDPFYDRTINLNIMRQYSFTQIQKYCITLIDILVNSGINANACSLGSYYVLCALTIVSPDAAEALPWLYEATIY